MADHCLFCRIVRGELPASVVYRNDRVTAFMDIQPVNAGHVLVVPNVHIVGLSDLDPQDGEAMFRVAQQIAKALKASTLLCEGVNLFLADGEAAMQEVFHAHLHVFPRWAGDGFGLTFGSHYANKPPRESLDAVAAELSRLL